jgi:hypothetical protein
MRTTSNKLNVFSAFVVVWLLGAGRGVAAQDQIAGLLVRLQYTLDELGSETRFEHFEYLYYRDGLVIAKVASEGSVRLLRGTLSTQNLAQLKQTLSENHVGLIVAAPGCKVPSPTPNTVSLVDGALTWFGKNGRQNYLTVNGPRGDNCPSELTILFLDLYALHVDYTDDVKTLP